MYFLSNKAEIHRASGRRLALFLPSVECGGAERIMVSLLRGLVDHGVPVDLVLGKAAGPFLEQVPHDARIIELGVSRMRWAVPGLARYLRRERPFALLSRMSHTNLAALCAKRLAGVDVRVAVVEASHVSGQTKAGHLGRGALWMMRRMYPLADAVIGVSEGVSRDLETVLRRPTGWAHTIYNPVVDSVVERIADVRGLHPWLLNRTVPVFLAVGRLAAVKDYATLLRAFALTRQAQESKLIVLGEGPERRSLEQLSNQLGISQHVALPGYTDNPYSAMARASAFVLSSRFEGLPNAMIEALACGCPVVATDCPSGPAEILESGKYGELSPVGEPVALAQAMLRAAAQPVSRQLLQMRGAQFSLERALPQYLTVLGYPAPVQRKVA